MFWLFSWRRIEGDWFLAAHQQGAVQLCLPSDSPVSLLFLLGTRCSAMGGHLSIW